MNSICCINGVLNQSTLPLSLSHLGVGVFETLLLSRRPASGAGQLYALGLNDHLDRLYRGVSIIGLKSVERCSLLREIELAARSANWGEAVQAKLRVVVLKQDHIVWIEPLAADYFSVCQTGVRAVSFSGERSMPYIKSCSALVCHLAHKYALDNGAGEALLVDRDGIVREGAWSNFFWIDERSRIRTPATGMLPGITRKLVIEAIGGNVIECDVSLAEILDRAKEAFITQSTRGVVFLTAVDNKMLTSDSAESITRKLQLKIAEALQSKRVQILAD